MAVFGSPFSGLANLCYTGTRASKRSATKGFDELAKKAKEAKNLTFN